MSWRRLGVLVRQLPRDSATVQAALGADGQWTLDNHLLAALIDAVNVGNWQRGGGKGRKPKPIPRPGVGPKKRRFGSASLSVDELNRRLGR